MPQSRRRLPRLEVLGLVDGQLLPLDIPLTVRELSEGGFSVVSSSAFPPGCRHHFRFTTITQEVVTLDAVAVHCRLVKADAGDQVSFVTGFEFMCTAGTDRAVSVLVDTLTSVLQFE
jgi:hypothetical protein